MQVSTRLFTISLLLATTALAQESTTADANLKPHPLVAPALEKINAGVQSGPFAPNWSSLEKYEIPQWYKDAKFGIFVHWGAYSVPAFGSEWYPRQMYIDLARRGDNFFEHHNAKYGSQKDFGYKDFIPQFKAEKFDANAWAQLFHETGARYVIPVAEHHDGFPMYDCAFTDWDASEKGPKRDVIAELSKAVRGKGMKFGLSSHRAFNWMYYVRNKSFDNADPKYARLYGRPMPFLFDKDAWDYKNNFVPQDEQFKNDWLARSCELVDKYDPDVIWFDFGITPGLREAKYDENPFAEHLQRFAAYYYNVSAKEGDVGIINYKWGAFPEAAAVLDKERSKMAEIRKPFWQTDTAVSSSSWGYTQNQRYKKPGRLINDLIDIVSKNGCLLLNVGPKSDGTIPDEDQSDSASDWWLVKGQWRIDLRYDVLEDIRRRSDCRVDGHVSRSKDKPFTSEDIRFTARDNVLYVTGLKWPENNQITVKTLANGSKHFPEQIKSVEFLGYDGVLKWNRSADGLAVSLPAGKRSEYAYVLKVTK